MTDKNLPALPEPDASALLDDWAEAAGLHFVRLGHVQYTTSTVRIEDLLQLVRASFDLGRAAVAQRDEQIRWWRERWHDMERQRDELRAEFEALLAAIEPLMRWHLDNADVHPCDENNDRARALRCIREVQVAHAAIAEERAKATGEAQ